MVQISLFDLQGPPEPISGEAFTLSPLDFIIAPLGAALKLPTSGFLKIIANLFKAPVKAASGFEVAGSGFTLRSLAIPRITVSPSTKALVGAGIVGGTATTGFLTLTPQGGDLINLASDFVDVGGKVATGGTNLFSDNPLLLAGLIGLGAIVLLK